MASEIPNSSLPVRSGLLIDVLSVWDCFESFPPARGRVLRGGAGSGPCPAELTSDMGQALRRDGQKSVEHGHDQAFRGREELLGQCTAGWGCKTQKERRDYQNSGQLVEFMKYGLFLPQFLKVPISSGFGGPCRSKQKTPKYFRFTRDQCLLTQLTKPNTQKLTPKCSTHP